MIEIRELTKKYGDTIIFDNANYTFPDKGLVCLLGASGCGKSTLLNLLAGFDSNYSGTITVNGLSLNNLSAEELCTYRQKHIGFVFQNYHLLKGYSVLENILLPCELKDLEKQDNMKNAESLLRLFGLLDKKNQNIENLSGGQKQRVAIARALMSNPSTILADEPTGALDRGTSTEIMALLKEISKEKLVVVITHDQKICDFADEVLTVKEGKLICTSQKVQQENGGCEKTVLPSTSTKVSPLKLGMKNFTVHVKRYLAISFIISISVFCFLLSLSFGNTIENSIEDFKVKNTAFNNGYVKVTADSFHETFHLLNEEERLEHVYAQFKLNDITLKFNETIEHMQEKYPMPKATESMSYGVMPRRNENEIALSPSLAKKFMSNIKALIGEEITLEYKDETYKLTISGIFNADYDDFFISSDIEQTLYKGIKDTPYSISYDVTNFEDIVPFSQHLSENNITSVNASIEVEAFQNTFETINRLFLIVSSLILCVGIFISSILLVKLQNSRYREIGLLSALGFHKNIIRNMIISENLMLATMAGLFHAVWIFCAFVVNKVTPLSICISSFQIGISIIATLFLIALISVIASHKLIHTEPADALRK